MILHVEDAGPVRIAIDDDALGERCASEASEEGVAAVVSDSSRKKA